MSSPGVDSIIPQLDTAFSRGQQIKTDVEATFARLNGQIAQMMTRFQGQAPAVFLTKHEEWKGQINRLVVELDRISKAAKASADRQRQLEADSQAAFNNVV